MRLATSSQLPSQLPCLGTDNLGSVEWTKIM